MCRFTPLQPWELEIVRAPDEQVIQEYQWLSDNMFVHDLMVPIEFKRQTVGQMKRFSKGLEEGGAKAKFVVQPDEAFERLCAQYKS